MMSDFVGILASGKSVFHLVDWDRPVWLSPGDVDGPRCSPHPDHFIADCVAVLRENALSRCTTSCGRSEASYFDFSGDDSNCMHLSSARQLVYSLKEDPWLLITRREISETFLIQDINRLLTKVVLVAVDDRVAFELGLS